MYHIRVVPIPIVPDLVPVSLCDVHIPIISSRPVCIHSIHGNLVHHQKLCAQYALNSFHVPLIYILGDFQYSGI